MEVLQHVCDSKSILLVPAFAIDRTQQIIFIIDRLIASGLVPEIDIHVDSPMAVSATDIYLKYPSLHSVDLDRLGKGSGLHGRRLHLHRKRKSSKMLNKLKGPAVIISASGMLTGGRILHHLINRLPDPSTTVALVGYMAEGTLGRQLEEGAKQIYIHKQPVEVKAKVVMLGGLSGHADYYEILHWAEPIARPPKKAFITHGEPAQAAAMAAHFEKEYGWNCHVARHDETVELS